MKYIYILTILVLSFILLVNVPFGSQIMDELFYHKGYYAYSNTDGTYTLFCKEWKGDKSYPKYKHLSLTEIDSSIDYNPKFPPLPIGRELRQLYPDADTVVYRLFTKNPLIFWHWGEYICGNPKYDFPYKSWEEIKKQRPKDFKKDNQWQMF